MPLNVKLLKKVKKHILQEPKRLRMDLWLKKGTPNSTFQADGGYNEPKAFDFPKCGTVGCIAGWAVLLNHPDVKEERFGIYGTSSMAVEELTISRSYQPFDLFYVTHWPEKQQNKYLAASTQEERAKIVGQVIDLYIREYQKIEKAYTDAEG